MLKQAQGTQCNHNCNYCTVKLSFTSAKLVQSAVRNRNGVSQYIMQGAFQSARCLRSENVAIDALFSLSDRPIFPKELMLCSKDFFLQYTGNMFLVLNFQ